jgi:hypothetical protein
LPVPGGVWSSKVAAGAGGDYELGPSLPNDERLETRSQKRRERYRTSLPALWRSDVDKPVHFRRSLVDGRTATVKIDVLASR